MAELRRRLRRIERFNRVERHLADRQNPLEVFSDEEIFQRYRFRPRSIYILVGLIFEQTERPTMRSSPLPPLLALLLTLQFFATGAHHALIAHVHGVSRPTVVRTIKRVTKALCSLLDRFVCFPTDNAERIKMEFFNIARFPKVLGCVDGTQIKIMRPCRNEADFVNRKGFHALNIQMVCDPHFRITNVVAKWPGSVHDSIIFRESDLCNRFERGDYDGLLLGDSGYPCRPFLMTPYGNPIGPAQERFNIALCRTRVLVEQTFGIVKRRFPCLTYGLRTDPASACEIVVACTILHDFGLEQGDIFCRAIDTPHMPQDDNNNREVEQTGSAYRDYLSEHFFSR